MDFRERTKFKIAISKIKNEEKAMNKNKINIFKIATVACCTLVLTTGVVFAKDIGNFIKYYFRGANNLINEAAEKGYVEDVNMNVINAETTLTHEESGKVIDNVEASVKIDEFLMDDANLSTNFTFKFDDKIKEVFDLDNLQYIFLTDLMVFDEENRILASNCSEEDFERICKENNLDYNLDEYFLDINPTSSNSLNNHNKEENLVKYTFNFHAENKYFPNSKELNFVFTKIKLEKYEEYTGQNIENGEYLKSNSVILTGNWKIKVEVPEKMYNREKNEYEVISVSNPDIDVTYASASETGFKFNAFISDTLNKSMDKSSMIKTHYMNSSEQEKSIDKITHITNSKGEKYEVLNATTALVESEENKYEFTGTFYMTKYDATDKLTVTLIYYGEPVYIELEKIK